MLWLFVFVAIAHVVVITYCAYSYYIAFVATWITLNLPIVDGYRAGDKANV